MGRREDRLLRKLEKDPAMECNKVRQKYCPDLFQDFANTKDPRNLSYTDYSNREMLGTVYYGKNVPLFRRNGYRKPGAMIP